MKFRIGPAGFGGKSIEKIKELYELGINHVEVEFVHNIYMKEPEARELGKLAKKLNMTLTIHAPYYINLNSNDEEKVEASKKRILGSCRLGHFMKAKYVTFHAGFYGKDSREQTYNKIKAEIQKMQEEIKKNGWKIKLAPELTGKKSQFGNEDELLELKKETGCFLCVDFAHYKARYQNKKSYKELIQKLKKAKIKQVYSHFSGIEYGEKGEKRHKLTDLKETEEILKEIKKNKLGLIMVNESPDDIKDALKTIRIAQKLNMF